MIRNFIGNLASPVEPGQVIFVAGTSTPEAQRFDVNLACGKFTEGGVALHMSFRFDESIVVRNSYIADLGWSAEERQENLIDEYNVMPIIPGDPFRIYIHVAEDKFSVSINDLPFCVYPHRVELESIRTVSVRQDVADITNIDHRQVYPFPHPIIQQKMPKHEFSNNVPKPFAPGHVIVMMATPYGNPSGTFTIHFTEGDNPRKHALFFNARFNQGVVGKNHTTDIGNFGFEDQDGGFPFSIDTQFKLAIALTEHSFRFAVNGEYFSEFIYRSGNVLEKLNGFHVTGGNGLKLDITSVDHLNMGIMDCEGFESYSDQSVEIN